MTNTTTALYTNDHSGEICCIEHVGRYAQDAITARPDAKRWRTPLGDWVGWSAADDAAWVAEFGKSAECEICRYNARRAASAAATA